MTDERGHATTFFYDDADRPTSVQDALGNATSYGYDADSRRISVTDANLHTTKYDWDARSRLQTVHYPDNVTTTGYTYDGRGHELTITDQASNVTQKTYDAVGRLKTVLDATKVGLTTYSYDLNSNLQSILDADNHTTSFYYDDLDRRQQRTLPLGMSEYYTYDPVGNLQTRQDFNGKVTTFNHDALHRLLSKMPDSSLNQPTVTFTYYPTGKRQSMSDASGVTSYTYDNRDRLTSKVTPQFLVEAGASAFEQRGAAVRGAADVGCVAAVEALIAGVSQARDENGGLPNDAKAALEAGLLSAAAAGNAEICRILLKAGADVDARDGGPQGLTSLMYAALTGNENIARLVISSGADVNCTAVNGWSPLMMAADKCHGDVLNALLAAGADPSLRNNHGITALQLARAAGCDAAVQLLTTWPTRPT